MNKKRDPKGRDIENVYVLIRRNFHEIEIIGVYTAYQDVTADKRKLDNEFKGKKRNFDYYEIHKKALIHNRKAARERNKK